MIGGIALNKVLLVMYLILAVKKRKEELNLVKGGVKFAVIAFYTNFFDTWGSVLLRRRLLRGDL